jgi:hypothetical protein
MTRIKAKAVTVATAPKILGPAFSSGLEIAGIWRFSAMADYMNRS